MNKFTVSGDEDNREKLGTMNAFNVIERDDHYVVTRGPFKYRTDEKELDYEEILDAYVEFKENGYTG